jgi:hypothetical protein
MGQGTRAESGRLSTVDLLVLTSLDQLLYYLPFYKTNNLNEEVNCTEPSSSVSIPWTREPKLKGVAQCISPPCTNQFRLAVFDIANTIYLLKWATLMSRSTVLSLPL